MSNFEFLKNHHEELYQLCLKAESKGKIEPEQCLLASRIALECFAESVCLSNNIDIINKEYGNKKTLDKLINELRDNHILARVGNIHKLRKKVNKSAHYDKDKSITTQESIEAVDTLHTIIADYYRKKKRVHVQDFNIDEMTIGDFNPKKLLGHNAIESCKKKYLGIYTDQRTGKEFKCVVREFETSGDNDEVRLRDTRVLHERWTSDPPKNVVQHIVLTNSSESDLVFTAYVVSEDSTTLKEMQLQGVSKLERLKIVQGIANGLEELHDFEEPIYHRLLNPSSIYIIKNKKGDLVPKIGNFEYAKLNNAKVGTVGGDLAQIVSYYKAPELDSLKTEVNPKIDIYSFGVTILFIFGVNTLNVRELSRRGLSPKFVDMVKSMLSTPQLRPELTSIRTIVDTEVALNV